ncbi:MAG: aldose 1-epimerase family protein, partial [Ruminiclostridium sp.]|nr:aldose 1-epimerase family protein [Ruminiclostridium sp.]
MEISLTNGGASVKILDKGAELRSLNLSGKELMWCADPTFWGKSSPILFPMIGNLRGDKTIIAGQEYSITKHGFARDNVFSYSKTSENSAVFKFSSNDETRKSYPFDFELKLRYTLNENSLEMLYSVTNTGNASMIYCIGAHPAFACPNEEGAAFNDYKLVFSEAETVKSPIMNLDTRMWGDNDRIERLNN